jgi:type I site-specific restriction endonuclease
MQTLYITPEITYRGIEIDIEKFKSKFGIKGYKAILRKFTVRYKSPIGTFYIEKKNYISDKTKLILPRFSTEKLIKAGIIGKPIINIEHEKNNIELNYLGSPTYNQSVIANHILNNYYCEEKKNIGQCGLTAFMEAGSGKTFLAMYIMSILKVKTLIITPNTYLLNQWKQTLEEFIENPNIGVYYGKEKKDGDIVIGIINSLSKDEMEWTEGKGKNKKITTMKSKDYYKKFDLVILDESHLYCTDSFKKIYQLAQRPYMLGLSATPNENTNGLDIISHLNIGEVLNCKDLEGYENTNNDFSSEVKVIKYKGPDELSQNRLLESNGMISTVLMLEDLINDNCRNNMIVKEIEEMLSKTKNIFVFSDRRQHCEALEELLFLKAKENNKEFKIEIEETENNEDQIIVKVVMYGGVCINTIEKAKIEANVIFTTYSYSSTGVSIDHMTGLILATPRKSKARQIVGRVFRNNKKFQSDDRYIVDIVDINNVFKNQYRYRKSAYVERNSVITSVCVEYKEFK